jgi:hypothetical protein
MLQLNTLFFTLLNIIFRMKEIRDKKRNGRVNIKDVETEKLKY